MTRAGLNSSIVTACAAAIVDADGVAQLSLSRVAAQLHVAPPSLYKHVAGLDDLILRITTLAIRRLADDLMTAAVGRSGREALVAVATAYRRFAMAHVGLYPLTQGSLQPGSEPLHAESQRALEVLAATVGSYGVPEDLTIHAIRIVRAGLHGYADIEARGGFRLPCSVEESFQVLVDALDTWLRTLGRSSGEVSGSHGELFTTR